MRLFKILSLLIKILGQFCKTPGLANTVSLRPRNPKNIFIREQCEIAHHNDYIARTFTFEKKDQTNLNNASRKVHLHHINSVYDIS